MKEYWVVVVDDEPFSLTDAKNLLNEQGMRVSCLRSGRDLLKFMEKHAPDLILLDIMMPDMDGFETYRALRQFEETERRAQIPVIFLTGEKDHETERRGLKAGASDFVLKPFDRDVLIKRVNNTIANSRMIESLTEEATLDKLTGFLNKNSGTERAKELCRSCEGTLMILDLDSFKLVNDLFGHDMGDRVLVAFSEVVRHNVRSDDMVSRIGGDEFMVFFRNAVNTEAVSALTDRLNGQLLQEAKKLMGEDFGIPLGISVGAVFVPEYGTDFTELFRLADNSLYRVKENRKHGFEVYDRTREGTEEERDLNLEISRVSRLMEERGAARGAMLLGKDDFASTYRYVMRFIKRYRSRAAKLVFALNPVEPGTDLFQASVEFGELLKNTFRKSDIITQNRPNQYFSLLYDMAEEYIDRVIERIREAWEKNPHAAEVTLDYAFEYLDYRKDDNSQDGQYGSEQK